MREYKVGDKVWVARTGMEQVKEVCPVCFGNKVVHIILGDGEKIELKCDYCSPGYDPPRGFVMEYQHIEKAEQMTITKKEIKEEPEGRTVEYRAGYNCLNDGIIFDTEEEARKAAKEIVRNRQEEEFEQSLRRKQNAQTNRTYSWGAGYHRKCAKEAIRQLAYHETAARVCKERSKTD